MADPVGGSTPTPADPSESCTQRACDCPCHETPEPDSRFPVGEVEWSFGDFNVTRWPDGDITASHGPEGLLFKRDQGRQLAAAILAACDEDERLADQKEAGHV